MRRMKWAVLQIANGEVTQKVLPRLHTHANLTNIVGSQPVYKTKKKRHFTKTRRRKLIIFSSEIRVLEIEMAAEDVSSERSCTVTDVRREECDRLAANTRMRD